MRTPVPAPAIADPAEPDRREIARAGWRVAIATAAGVRALFFLVAWGGAWLLSTSTQERLRDGAFSIWSRWDAAILLRIAEHGYTAAADPHATAFFPLYPLTVRALSSLGLPTLAAGLALSAAASIVAFAYLYRLAEEEIGLGAGRRAVVLLAFFPTAVFLVAPYTESLFLAGAIAAFYYARRERWAMVGFPAAVAMGARFAGVFVIAGLLVEFARQRNFSSQRLRRFSAAIVGGVAPLGAYMAYLAASHDSPFAFVTAQADGWGRRFAWPWDAFVTTWHTNAGYATNWIFAWKVEMLAAVVGVALVGLALAKRSWSYAVYMGTSLSVLLVSTWYMSIPRMLLSLFPTVLFASARIRRHPREYEWFSIGFAAFATLGVLVYTRGAWFF